MNPEQYALMRQLEDVHWWYRSLHGLVGDALADARRVLDVGCGTGGLLARLAGREAYGIDLSPLALGLAQERGLSRLVRGDAALLPFADGAFDAVCLLDVLYHADVRDDVAALAEARRVLRPGGLLVVQAPAFSSLAGAHDRAVHGVRRYREGDLKGRIARAGLTVLRAGYRNLLPLPIAFAKRRCLRGPTADLAPLPRWLNAPLTWLGRLEGAFCRVRPLPLGLSVWCVARKPSAASAVEAA